MKESMEKNNFAGWLLKNHVCAEAVRWAGNKSESQAWKTCQRADWLIWYLGKKLGTPHYPDINQIILIASWCTRRSLKNVPPGEDRPRLAVEAAEKCAKNNTKENRFAAESAGFAAESAGFAEHKIMSDYIRKTVRLQFRVVK